MCYLTDNRWGNSDVDDGTVELLSPIFQVMPGPLSVSFDYFLGLVNENGQDRLTLEWSFSESAGAPFTPWQPLWRANLDSQGGWRSVVLPWQALESLQVEGAQQVRLRFLARDGYPPSVVEAGLDRILIGASGCF